MNTIIPTSIWTGVIAKIKLSKRIHQIFKIGKFVFDLNEKGVRFNDKDFCFERAVLAHGDYLLEGNTDYWNLLSTETVAKNVKRDLSWKRMLRMGDDKVMQKEKTRQSDF